MRAQKYVYVAPMLILCGLLFIGLLIYKGRESAADRIQKAQARECVQNNILRHDLATQGKAIQLFLVTAAETREKTAAQNAKDGETDLQANNLQAAKTYRELAASIAIPTEVNCSFILGENRREEE